MNLLKRLWAWVQGEDPAFEPLRNYRSAWSALERATRHERANQ